MKVAGLLSGTSADAVDAVLLEVSDPAGEPDGARLGGPTPGSGDLPRATLLAYREFPLPVEIRHRVLAATRCDADTRALALLRRELGTAFAAALRALLREAGVSPAQVAAVGSHGQTVWHEPPGADREAGTSLQLDDPAIIAAHTGVPVVGDFRSADLAAGGQGAPLVPWPDRVLFGGPAGVVLQNLGGMGNVTWLPPRDTPEDPLAFDTGPGNALLDAAASLATGGRASFDEGGELARRGRVDEGLLARLLEDPFFRRPPPRSTGRERFGAPLVEALARERELVPGTEEGWPDLLATLAALTVESVVHSLRAWIVPLGVERILVTGGGARNPVLVEGLRTGLAPLPVTTDAQALGMDPGAREAAAFALLAWAFLHGVPGNVPRCTGASGRRVLGSWTPAPGRAAVLPRGRGGP